MMITIMGGLAQEESTSISKNMKWSYTKRFERGKVNAFSTPFGYEMKQGKLHVNEKQAEIVKEIFSMYLCGAGYQKISDSSNDKYKSFDGQFSYYGIRYILSNEKYMGDSLYQKTYVKNVLPYKKAENKGELNKYYITDTHQGIISHEDFNKVQELIKQRTHEGKMNKYLFSKKIFCGNC